MSVSHRKLPQARTYIHLLPPELRLQIYNYAIQDHYDFLNQKRLRLDMPDHPPMPLICRPSQLYPALFRFDSLLADEAAPILFSTKYPFYFAFLTAVKRLSAVHRAHIKETGIRLIDRLPDKIARSVFLSYPESSTSYCKASGRNWAKGFKAQIHQIPLLLPNLRRLDL